jgi:hypothetical protein
LYFASDVFGLALDLVFVHEVSFGVKWKNAIVSLIRLQCRLAKVRSFVGAIADTNCEWRAVVKVEYDRFFPRKMSAKCCHTWPPLRHLGFTLCNVHNFPGDVFG